MDILKNLDKITERITELESIRQAANDFISHFDKAGNIDNKVMKIESVNLDFQNLRSLLKGKD